MTDYDFSTLNDKEFEILVADIISDKEQCHVERFKSGKDGGKDGRFFSPDGGEVVIQCKHWLKTGITKLIKELKEKEIDKIKKISPKRYIFATSLDLSDSNKNKILEVLKPFIKTPDDILSKTDLNDHLSKNGNIEKKHYKLWLSSTNVLNIIFNNAIIGRSDYQIQEFHEFSKKYVITDNHKKAIDKLEEKNCIIITGEGGIGKTSLAGQLSLSYISKGFEFYSIESSINEAEKVFYKDRKQIFYFDDFLGRNYLTALEKHEDSKIVQFIKRISKDKKKRFILTSRSTILNQGKLISDQFEINKTNKNEYQLNIESLTDLDKAKILYNHIWFGDLKEQYIDCLYQDNKYLKIISHKNYNPRIIEFITDHERLTNVSSNEYFEYLISKLDNPKDIWEDVFERQIDNDSIIAVLLIVFNGRNRIQDRIFKNAFNRYYLKANKPAGSFDKMTKKATGTIINRNIGRNNDVYFNLFNPSITDFVLNKYMLDLSLTRSVFCALETVESIENLRSLIFNNKITKNEFKDVLGYICNTKLKKESNSSFEYKIKLYYRVSFYEDLLTKYFDHIIYLIEVVSKKTKDATNYCIKESCNLLAIYNGSERLELRNIASITKDFILDAIKYIDEYDDYVELNRLIDALEYSELNLISFKKSFTECFEKIITKEAIKSDQFDYMGITDYSYCESDIDNEDFRSFVEGMLKEIDSISFSEDDYIEFIYAIDIEEIITHNRDSNHDFNHSYEMNDNIVDAANNSIDSEEDQIIDLFDRN